MTLVRIAVQLPAGFPEKYRAAIERAIDHCAVKKHIVEPPRFEISVSEASGEPVASSVALPHA